MGALLGFQVGMLLVAILDKLYDLRSYPTGGSTMLAAFAFGLFGSIVIGVVVAMWWDKESR